jgi:hypothetical protein
MAPGRVERPGRSPAQYRDSAQRDRGTIRDIYKKVQKTGPFLHYIFIAFLNGTCGPDLV